MLLSGSVVSLSNPTHILILPDTKCVYAFHQTSSSVHSVSNPGIWAIHTSSYLYTHSNAPLSHCAVSLYPPQARLQMLSLPLWSSPTLQIEMCVSKSRQLRLVDTVCAQTVALLMLEPPSMFQVCKNVCIFSEHRWKSQLKFKLALWFSRHSESRMTLIKNLCF